MLCRFVLFKFYRGVDSLLELLFFFLFISSACRYSIMVLPLCITTFLWNLFLGKKGPLIILLCIWILEGILISVVEIFSSSWYLTLHLINSWVLPRSGGDMLITWLNEHFLFVFKLYFYLDCLIILVTYSDIYLSLIFLLYGFYFDL